MFNLILKLKDPCYNCDALPKYLKFTNRYQAIELFDAQNIRVDEAGVCHSQYPKSGSTLNHLILANFATPKLFGQRLHSISTIYSKYFL